MDVSSDFFLEGVRICTCCLLIGVSGIHSSRRHSGTTPFLFFFIFHWGGCPRPPSRAFSVRSGGAACVATRRRWTWTRPPRFFCSWQTNQNIIPTTARHDIWQPSSRNIIIGPGGAGGAGGGGWVSGTRDWRGAGQRAKRGATYRMGGCD